MSKKARLRRVKSPIERLAHWYEAVFTRDRCDLIQKALNNDTAEAYVWRLWCYAWDKHSDGVIPESEMADGAGYSGNPEMFAKAVRESGFVDSDGMLVGWDDEGCF